MTSLRSRWPMVLVLTAMACGPTEQPQDAAPATSATTDAIVGGTIANGDPAVVAIAIRYGGGYQSLCTGTLVAPKTVLTAAHCIYAYGTNLTYYVTFGTDSTSPTRAVQVTQQIAHPSYNRTAWDFGVLRLAEPVLNVPPIPMNELPMGASLVGRTIRHVGFGITSGSAQDSGTKREVAFPLRGVQSYTIESGAQGKQTCSGDSGGPGFMTMPGSAGESVVGVVSYGDQDCLYGGYDGRVDIVVPWVRQTMAAWEAPTCALDGKCLAGCMPIDQDCACAADGVCGADCTDPAVDVDCPRDCVRNGVCAQQGCGRPDVDCVPEGQLCTAAVQCKERLCVNDAQHPETYCTRTCASATDCPSEMSCVSGSCIMKQKPERQLFESCYAQNDFCVASICTGPAGGISRCVKSCVVNGDCPSGSTCEAGSDSRRYCRPADLRFHNITLPAAQASLGAGAQGCSAVGGSAGLWLVASLLVRRRRAGRA